MAFTESQIQRYARHILLREIGGGGQARLLGSRVLVVGAGGLGAPLLLYLAAAGVGTLGIVDDDRVELSNLQRQVIYTGDDLDRPKAAAAAARLAALNPDIRIEAHAERLTAANALDLAARYDLVADGSDNLATRFIVNDACHFAGRPLVAAALAGFDGQIATFKSHLGPPHPCYRCLYPVPPDPDLAPSCAAAGVLGAVAGVLGSVQAVEVVKELLGLGEGLSGWHLHYDALAAEWHRTRLRRNPACPLHGERPTITGVGR
ncbi:MAG TPA: molybdopterin-synthase adenylyltransferase MoeB [Alphaproteobacteria bacterium]|nr:molybdopterin-synthase adenylyltransferase MoeB [Alphaproteobacteria bacterium]